MSNDPTTGQVPGATDGERPIRPVLIDGVPHVWGQSRLVRLVAGGEGEPPAAGEGAGGSGGTTTPPATPPAKPPEDEPFDRDRAIATIRKLRETEKATKEQLKELDTLRAKVKAAEDAQLSDQEKLTRERDEATKRAEAAAAELKSERTRSAIERAAAKVGFVDPEDAFLRVGSQVEFDDDGKPTNVEALVTQLAKDKPYLVGASNGTPPRPGNPPGPKSTGTNPDGDAVQKSRQALIASGRYSSF